MAIIFEHRPKFPEDSGVSAGENPLLRVVDSDLPSMETVDPATLAKGDSFTLYSINTIIRYAVTDVDKDGWLEGRLSVSSFGKQPFLSMRGNDFEYIEADTEYNAFMSPLARVEENRAATFQIVNSRGRKVHHITERITYADVELAENGQHGFDQSFIEALEDVVTPDFMETLRDLGYVAIDSDD